MTLQRALPSVLDGEPAGIHEARIATRRIRELLPFLGPEPGWPGADDLRSRVKRIGRSLGRVRDADVRLVLLASLEDRIPHAAPTLVLVRQRLQHSRLSLMRKLIKRLERLDAVRLVDALGRHHPPRFAILHRAARAAAWRRELRTALNVRAQAAAESIAHATGVYFPNRAHAARIAVKRLRYAAEIVHHTGCADQSDAIRELKKAQDLLGDLHDRQELSDRLALEVSQTTLPPPQDGLEHVALIRQMIDADARRLHERYLQRRDRLMAICHEILVVPGRRTINPAPLLAIATLALSSGIYAAQRSRH